MIDFPPNTKYCGTCRKRKDRSEFHKDKSCKDGLSARCKECKREWGQSNHEKTAEIARCWREANPEKVRTSVRAWSDRNPDYSKEYSQAYRLANPEKTKQASRNWVINNPIKNALKALRRRARIKGNGGEFTETEWLELCEYYDYTCLCCGQREPGIKLTVDHVVPIAKGGLNTIENIQPLCQSCNSSKGTEIMDYRL